jgi:WD40 repeat protein
MEMLEKEKAKSKEILRQNEDLELKCKEINQKAIEVVNSTYQDVENKLIP